MAHTCEQSTLDDGYGEELGEVGVGQLCDPRADTQGEKEEDNVEGKADRGIPDLALRPFIPNQGEGLGWCKGEG